VTLKFLIVSATSAALIVALSYQMGVNPVDTSNFRRGEMECHHKDDSSKDKCDCRSKESNPAHQNELGDSDSATGGHAEMMVVNIPSHNLSGSEAHFTAYEVPRKLDMLDSVYRKLFEINSGDRGYNGLKYESVTVAEGTARVNMSGEWYPVGDLSGVYMRNDVNGSAFQFGSVKRVKVYINGKLFDWCVDSDADPDESHCDTSHHDWDDARK